MPARTSAWSSTMKTRMVILFPLSLAVLRGYAPGTTVQLGRPYDPLPCARPGQTSDFPGNPPSMARCCYIALALALSSPFLLAHPHARARRVSPRSRHLSRRIAAAATQWLADVRAISDAGDNGSRAGIAATPGLSRYSLRNLRSRDGQRGDEHDRRHLRRRRKLRCC